MIEPLKILIGIFTTQKNNRAAACRKTWLQDLPKYSSLQAVFLRSDPTLAQPVQIDDCVSMPGPDEYALLSRCTRWFAQWALETQEFDYLFKCVDDTYVALDRLAAYDPAGRDYVGGPFVPGYTYGDGGAGYWLSPRAAEIIARDMTADAGCEDVLAGILLNRAGIVLSPDERYKARKEHGIPEPTNDLITSHHLGAEDLQKIYDGLHAVPAQA
jgi:hypothetical protein